MYNETRGLVNTTVRTIENIPMEDTTDKMSPITEVAKSIPDEAWLILVRSATETVRQLLAPLTATSEGIGKIISSKFDRLTEGEKLLAADTMNAASNIIHKKGNVVGNNYKPQVLISILENSALETDLELRDAWAMLL